MTITEDKTIIPETAAEIVYYGWETYRRSQQIPFPAEGAGDLMKAQSLLFNAAAMYACGDVSLPYADLDKIRMRTGYLISVIAEHCGAADAEFVSGQDGSAAA